MLYTVATTCHVHLFLPELPLLSCSMKCCLFLKTVLDCHPGNEMAESDNGTSRRRII